MEADLCILPGGWVDAKGKVHQEVKLRAMTGQEEALLLKHPKQESASLVTVVLARCVQRIGTISDVSESLCASLLVADRHYLLLRLRELTFGSQVQATIPCPWPDCGKKVDIDFLLSDIPVKASTEKTLLHTCALSTGASLSASGSVEQIVFRLPTGEDQSLIAPLLASNEAEALFALLKRCIVSIEKQPASDAVLAALSPMARMEIEQRMAALAPSLDLDMEIHCPECNRDFTAPFDLQDFFYGELRTSRDLLYREVHYLAYHYHWSEREIMAMPKATRRNYIAVLADEMEKLNSAV